MSRVFAAGILMFNAMINPLVAAARKNYGWVSLSM
jgi:hypothetical protein